jgi:hypothetical protein
MTRIDQLLREADSQIEQSSVGELLLGMRLRLRNALETQYGEEGRLRRGVLAILVIQHEVLPVWRKLVTDDQLASVVPRLHFVSKLVALSEEAYYLSDEDVDGYEYDAHSFSARLTSDDKNTRAAIDARRAYWLRWIREWFPMIIINN